MASVKAKFPSISIKRRPKNSSAPAASPPGGIVRPLTPEAQRKYKSFPAGSPTETCKTFVPIHSPTTDFTGPIFRNTSESNLSSLENLSRSFPDVRGSKHVRSVSQPNKPIFSHRTESVVSHDRSSSLNSETSYLGEYIETPMIDQEDIIALTHHVRNFSEALACLRNTFIECEENPESGAPEVRTHERLGEVLSILKGVLNKYQPLHSTDILASAGTLINRVKSHNYEEKTKVPEEFYESIDQLALAFSSSVSDFLMGDQEPLSGSIRESRSLDDLCDEDDEEGVGVGDEKGYEEDSDDDHDQEYVYKVDSREPEKKEADKSAEKANELDKSLLELEHGVDIALQRTKIWSKYSKDIATYVERRAHLEMEYTNKLSKLAQTTKTAITEHNFLPFQSIFITALEQDMEYADLFGKTYNALMGSRFMEPLNSRRTCHERSRKDVKDRWTKAYKKLNEALANLKKAKAMYIQKHQDLDKGKLAEAAKDKEESSAGLSFGRIQKKKEGDLKKADDAEEWYRQCVHDANVRQKELEAVKSQVLVELRQQVYQCDMTMKAVTCTYFQTMKSLSSVAPVQFQTLAESSRLYEPGTHFADYVRKQKEGSPIAVFREFSFQSYHPESTAGSAQSPSRHNSILDPRSENTSKNSPFTTRRHQSLNLRGNHGVAPSAFENVRANLSDADSGRSAHSSPNGSPSSVRKGKESVRLRKAFQASSEESDGGQDSDDKTRTSKKPTRVSPRKHRTPKTRPSAGPFHNSRLSAAAETHSLRKLRSPSKCRDCDSYVYFNGAECQVCGVTCHKKCLAKLAIKCGYQQRIQRRMTTFGVSLYHHLKDGELVPYIVSSCITEIDTRGLEYKGIYRVSGVKSTVEKLCQAFETDQSLVDLSTTPPHVIGAVLKLYLRQLPEPLLSFELYPAFMKVAKECFAVINKLTCKQAAEVEVPGYSDVIASLREVVMRLPEANLVTAARLISHLKRVSEHEEVNAMSASNLSIVFGPTLLRPSETPSSLSSLVDMPHQSRTVELLVSHPEVFEPAVIDEPDDDHQTPVESLQGLPSAAEETDVVQPDHDKKDDPDSDNQESLLHIPDAHSTPQPSPPGNIMSFSSSHEELNSSNSPATQPTPHSINKVLTTRRDLGFGHEFFELLARSNDRKDEVTDSQLYQVPPFLLPGTSQNESQAIDGSDFDSDGEDDTTQGTSGSRTPEDDLGVDKHRRSLPSSVENLSDDKGASRSRGPSVVSTGFGSDFPDESLLPDLSDTVTPKRGALDDGDVPYATHRARPNHLALRKRNSDLPGRVRRCDDWTGIFPVGTNPSNYIPEGRQAINNVSPASPSSESEAALVSSANGSVKDRRSKAIVFHNETPPLRENDRALGERAMSVELIPDERETRSQSEQNGEVMDSPEHATFEANSILEDTTSEHEPLLGTGDESRALFIPVDAAIQERRPTNANVREVTTPSCSTAQTNTQESGAGRADSPTTKEGTAEKRSEEGRGNSAKPRALARVSVKDRRRHYEPEGGASVSTRKISNSTKKGPSDMANVIDVAMRKQLFEHGGSYKRVSELGLRKPRSESAGSRSPAAKLLEESTDDADAKSVTSDEAISEEAEVQLRSKKENSEGERPRSLILDRLSKVGTEYEPLLDVDKLQPIDIPLDNENDDDDHRRHEKLRRTPSPSSPRGSKHSGHKGEEGREPQFV